MIHSSKSKRLVLLDAHAILHRAYHALPEFATSKGEPTGALYGLSAMLMKIATDLKPDYLIGAFDLPGPTFRREAYANYKGTRKKTEDALIAQIKKSRDVFKAFNIPAYDLAGFEADDILGTIVQKIQDSRFKILDSTLDIIIASGDMDTLQLVDDKKVQVYTLKKGINDTILYDEDEVIKRFGFTPKLLPDYKGLRGDPSDNIIGIAGIGEKTATTLITTFGTIEEIYKKLKKDKKAFEKAGITARIIKLLEEGEEEAEFSKMLATIRRDAPIDFKLPEKEWKESVDVSSVVNLFSELEFRTFGARVKELFGAQTLGLGLVEGIDEKSVPKDELEETLIALWVLNSNLTAPTLEDIYQYSKLDKWKEAKAYIWNELKKQDLDKVYNELEKPLIPIIKSMQERGVLIDKKELGELSKTYHKKLDILEKEIWQMAGSEFNVSSPKQLGEILFDRLNLTAKGLKKTAGGARSTKESELLKMKDLHPIIDKILSFRELSKLLTTYIDTIPTLLDSEDCLHARFIQTGTTTGRMGCENPNLQNIPNKTELGRAIRKSFVARKGFKLVAFDYSQIELRVAAFLSGDKKMIDIFNKGQDVHTAVASEVFGVPEKEVTKEMRRQAKVINFGIIYGMGINALRANLGTDRATAQTFYDNYFKNFSGLAEYLSNVKAEALKNGFTKTFFGRKRYFEGLKSHLPFIKAAAERMAINAPIQGTEADIVKLAMIKVNEFLTAKKMLGDAHLLLQVHDELVYEIRNSLVIELIPEIKKIMEEVVDPKTTSGIVCLTEHSVGDNWGEMNKM